MNKEQFAHILDGREYGNEITTAEMQHAKENGLVVVFGASDDLMEMRGAIYEECGTDALITKDGLLEECNCHCKYYAAAAKKASSIQAVWDPGDGYSWMYKTTIPHATFDIFEDGDKYCKGIVFSLNDL